MELYKLHAIHTSSAYVSHAILSRFCRVFFFLRALWFVRFPDGTTRDDTQSLGYLVCAVEMNLLIWMIRKGFKREFLNAILKMDDGISYSIVAPIYQTSFFSCSYLL